MSADGDRRPDDLQPRVAVDRRPVELLLARPHAGTCRPSRGRRSRRARRPARSRRSGARSRACRSDLACGARLPAGTTGSRGRARFRWRSATSAIRKAGTSSRRLRAAGVACRAPCSALHRRGILLSRDRTTAIWSGGPTRHPRGAVRRPGEAARSPAASPGAPAARRPSASPNARSLAAQIARSSPSRAAQTRRRRHRRPGRGSARREVAELGPGGPIHRTARGPTGRRRARSGSGRSSRRRGPA